MAPSMQSTTLIQPSALHLLCGRRRSRPFVSIRGGNGRLQIHGVAVRDTSSECKPALLAGSGHAGGGHSDRKKVLIVGAGWAGAGNTFHASWRCSVCTSAWPLWRHAPSPCNATCHRLWCSKAPVAAGLRGDAAGRIAEPWWPVFGMEDPTGPGSRSGWEHAVTLQAGSTAPCVTSPVSRARRWHTHGSCCTLVLTMTSDMQV